MRLRPGLILLLCACLAVYFFLAKDLWNQRAEARLQADASYVIPSKFSRILALEHKGLLSDYLLLEVITFYGERVMNQQQLKEEDYRYVIAGLEAVTDLDPYFLDPYILAEGTLAWEAGMVEEANRILEKGRRYRTEDWQLPFFIGFNHFYFLKDNEKGAEYLMEASRLPGSPSFLPSLAARLAYYGRKSKTAILFLKGMLAQTTDQRIRAGLEKRLKALEGADLLEDLMEKFKSERGRMPGSIEELVAGGYVETLPEEPYGGKWIIIGKGRVFSTSKFVISAE